MPIFFDQSKFFFFFLIKKKHSYMKLFRIMGLFICCYSFAVVWFAI